MEEILDGEIIKHRSHGKTITVLSLIYLVLTLFFILSEKLFYSLEGSEIGYIIGFIVLPIIAIVVNSVIIIKQLKISSGELSLPTISFYASSILFQYIFICFIVFTAAILIEDLVIDFPTFLIFLVMFFFYLLITLIVFFISWGKKQSILGKKWKHIIFIAFATIIAISALMFSLANYAIS